MAKPSEIVYNEIGDGRLVKMEVDCTERVDNVIPEAEQLAKTGNLKQAIELLYGVEKESRMAADMRSNTRVQLCIVQLCFKAQNWDELRDNIVKLTKKRSLIKQGVTKMIQECCNYVDQTPSKELCLKLIETLRTVTAGKIYLEVERARLTYKLSKMLEEEGKIDEAANVLLELQIETFGSMEGQEKVEILLEQMRLCLIRKDYVRAQIISRKIAVKFFDDSSHQIQALKLKYYTLMVELDQQDENYLSICRHYMAVAKTELVEKNAAELNDIMRKIVIYVILAPHSNEQWDLMNRIAENENIDKVSDYKEFLNLFIQQELITWQKDISDRYETLLRKGTPDSPATDVFALNHEVGNKRWENLQIRVGEHNIRMIAKYYSRVSLRRMSDLLNWPIDKTETFLCQLIVNGTIESAKINRPAGLVSFAPRPSPCEILDEWNNDASQIMDKLNKVCHLISKEEMVHKYLHSTTAGSTTDGTEKLRSVTANDEPEPMPMVIA